MLLVLDRAFSGGSTGGSLLLTLTFGSGGFNASLLLDRDFAGTFAGTSGGLMASGMCRGSLLLDLGFLPSDAGRFVSIFVASGVGSIFGVGIFGADTALFL